MPSVNLIWEQSITRRKGQRILSVMLAVIALAFVAVVGKTVGTYRYRQWCSEEIAGCEVRIRANMDPALRNQALQRQIAVLTPTLTLLDEAQHITLRWVSLMNEIDRSVPDPSELALSQLGFSVQAPNASANTNGNGKPSETPGLIGKLSIAGFTRSYALLSRVMRNLNAQQHVSEVRLTQAQADSANNTSASRTVRFTLQTQFCAPEEAVKADAGATRTAAAQQNAAGAVRAQ